MKLNEQIERLRSEGSTPDAKGRLIARLQQTQEHKAMKLIRRLSVPVALVASLSIVGALMVPRSALASPETVAKAIRNIQDYVINSFSVMDGKRVLMSTTKVSGGKSSRTFFDQDGKPVVEGAMSKLDGALFELAIGKPISGDGHEITIGDPTPGPGKKSVEIKVTKGKDGKAEKHYFVNGKEVKELPADMQGHVRIGTKLEGSPTLDSGQDHQIELSGVDIKSGNVHRVGGFFLQSTKDGVSTFASGQTSVDHLLKLLDDQSRWNIERGVVWAGQKLDKFTLKGPVNFIELYVDPRSSLPKVLRFTGHDPEGQSPQIEDEYVYGAVPPVNSNQK